MRQHRSSPGRPGDALLRISGSSGDPLLAAVLAALLSEGAKAIVAAASHRQAEAIISDILEYGRRLMAAGPARRHGPVPPPRGPGRPARPLAALGSWPVAPTGHDVPGNQYKCVK